MAVIIHQRPTFRNVGIVVVISGREMTTCRQTRGNIFSKYPRIIASQ